MADVDERSLGVILLDDRVPSSNLPCLVEIVFSFCFFAKALVRCSPFSHLPKSNRIHLPKQVTYLFLFFFFLPEMHTF